MRANATLLILLCALCWLPARRAHPRAPSRMLDNNCQCDCCYSVGARARTECVPPVATSFSVRACASCDIHACATRFPTACAQLSSLVTATCVKREGWLLRIVPVVFLAIVAALVGYGLCVRSFDGYHDDNLLRRPHSRGRHTPSYRTFDAAHGAPPAFDPAARSPLSTITEERPQTDARAPPADQPPPAVASANDASTAVQNVSRRTDAAPLMAAALPNPYQKAHVPPSDSEIQPAPRNPQVTAEPTLAAGRQHQPCGRHTTPFGDDEKLSDSSGASTPGTPPSHTVNHPAAARIQIEAHISRAAAAQSDQVVTEPIAEHAEISEPSPTITETPTSIPVAVRAAPATAPPALGADPAHAQEEESALEGGHFENPPVVAEVTTTVADDDVAQEIRTVESDPGQALPTGEPTSSQTDDGNDALPKSNAAETKVVVSVRTTEDPIDVANSEPAVPSELKESPETVEHREADVESGTRTLMHPTDMSAAREHEATDIEQMKVHEDMRLHAETENQAQEAPVANDGRPVEHVDSTSGDIHAQTEQVVGTEAVSQEEPENVMNARAQTTEGQNPKVEVDPVSARNIEATSEFQRPADDTTGEDAQPGNHVISDAFNAHVHIQEGLREEDKTTCQKEAPMPPVGTAGEADSSGAAVCLEEATHTADSNPGTELKSKSETPEANKHEPTDGFEDQEGDVQQGGDQLVLDTDDANIFGELVESRFEGVDVEAKSSEEEQNTLPTTTESSTPYELCGPDVSENENQVRTTRHGHGQGSREDAEREEPSSTRGFSVVQLNNGVSATPAAESMCVLDSEEKRQNDCVANTGEVLDPMRNDCHAQKSHANATSSDAAVCMDTKVENSAASAGMSVMNILRYECPAHDPEAQDAGEHTGNNNDKGDLNIESDTMTTSNPQKNDRGSRRTGTECENSAHTESHILTAQDIRSETTREAGILCALGTESGQDAQGNAVLVKIRDEEMEGGSEPTNDICTEEERHVSLSEQNIQADSVNAHRLPKTTKVLHEAESAAGGAAEIQGTVLTEDSSVSGQSSGIAPASAESSASAYLEKDQDKSKVTSGVTQHAEMIERPPDVNSRFSGDVGPVSERTREVEERPKDVEKYDPEAAVTGTEIHTDIYMGLETCGKNENNDGCTTASNTEGRSAEANAASKGHVEADTDIVYAIKPPAESFHTTADAAFPGTTMISSASEMSHDAEDGPETCAACPEKDVFEGDSHDVRCAVEGDSFKESVIRTNSTGEIIQDTLDKKVADFEQCATTKTDSASGASKPLDNPSADVGVSPSTFIASTSASGYGPEEIEVVPKVLDEQR